MHGILIGGRQHGSISGGGAGKVRVPDKLYILRGPGLGYHSVVMGIDRKDIDPAVEGLETPPLHIRLSKNAVFWILNVAGWTALCLANIFITGWLVLDDARSYIFAAAFYGLALPISGACRYLYQKIDYRKRSALSLILYVIGISLAAATVWYFSEVFIDMSIWPDTCGTEYLKSAVGPGKLVPKVFSTLWPFMMWSILYLVINFWLEWRRERHRAVKATLLAQKAQLEMLRYQLNPHFLFNALNSVRALIDENREGARDMITELADFLRYSLVHRDYGDVPLATEMEAVGHYLSIQKRRYEDNLVVGVHVSEAAGKFPVPCFLIHPLVENAVKYGMQTSDMPLEIEIGADSAGGRLTLTVSNTGTWVERGGREDNASAASGTGTGLENVRQRLAAAHPDGHSLNVSRREGRVIITLQIYGGPGQ